MSITTNITQAISDNLITSVVNLDSAGDIVEIVSDWSLWDGTNDFAVTNVLSLGNISGQGVARVSDGQAIIVYNDVLSSENRVAYLDVSSGICSLGTETSLSGTRFVAACGGTQMTDTRALFVGKNTGNSFPHAYLLDTSTSAPTELASDEGASGILTNYDVRRMDDDTGIFFYKISGNEMYAVTIDVSGDTCTFGTPLSFGTDEFGAAGCALSSTRAVVVGRNNVYLADRTGSTLTETDSIALTQTAGFSLAASVHAVSETEFIVFSQIFIPTTRYLYAQTFTVVGDTLVAGFEVELDVLTANINEVNDWSTSIGGGYYFLGFHLSLIHI